MTKTELLKAIRKAPVVFVGCTMTPHDVFYFKVSKAEARAIVSNCSEQSDPDSFRGDVFKDGNLYIG